MKLISVKKRLFTHYKIKELFVCNLKCFQYIRDIKTGKKTYKLFKFDKFTVKKQNYDGPLFYFKVNNLNNMGIECIQQWVNVAHILNSNFYFVCDKPSLEIKIRKCINFYTDDIKFIKSNKNATIKNILEKHVVKNWHNAGFAHLTTFYHAKENNINEFWNIDADDTYFFCNENKIAEILIKARKEAQDKNLNCLSLDMHSSKSNNSYWSFGITYCQKLDNLFEMLNTYDFKFPEYPDLKEGKNIDWCFTYLRNKKIFNINSFYVENLYFAHTAYLHSDTHKSLSINYWENDKYLLPYMYFFDKNFYLSIPQELIKIDVNLNNESKNNIQEFIINSEILKSHILKWHKDTRILH